MLIRLTVCLIACLLGLSACQRGPAQTTETIIKADDIPINKDAVKLRDTAENQDFDPQQPVGLPEKNPERQLGKYMTVIPVGAEADPGGNPLDPSVIDILAKLERGEELDRDEEITFLAIDQKFRHFDEIKAIGESQSD